MKKNSPWEDIPTKPGEIAGGAGGNRQIEGTIKKVEVTAKLNWQTKEPEVRDGKELKQVAISFEFPFTVDWDDGTKTTRYTVGGKYFNKFLEALYELDYELADWQELVGEKFLFDEERVVIPGREKTWDVYYPVKYIEA